MRGVELEGIDAAEPSREVLAALRGAEAIVVGPSNPVISIGPILAVPGMREAIAASPAPVVAVSPYVAGAVVKGPTDRFMAGVGRPTTAAGVASLYAGLIDGMVVDEGDPDPPPAEVPTLAAPTLMEGASGRARVARIVLDFAATASAAAELKATAVLPVKRFDARQAAAGRPGSTASAGGRWRRRWSPTCWRRSARRATIERTIVVSGDPVARSWPPRPAPRWSPTPATAATSGPPWPGSPGPKPRAPTCVVLLPGDCPLLDPRELDRLLTGLPTPYVGDRPRPPRRPAPTPWR